MTTAEAATALSAMLQGTGYRVTDSGVGDFQILLFLNFLHSYDQPSLKRKKRLDKRATSPKQRVLGEE